MDSNEIRRLFLGFFEERGHRVTASSSLIPKDPTLLLTNAGMNQFKPYFLGLEEPLHPRAATAQKVFRASDIENVGHTDRHLTFFEMLGNFSFGDYFKEDACRWAHELVTEGYGIEHDRLWVTVFEDDDEAVDVWADGVGIPRERIVRRGKEDNFWWMHVAGPCGPCSEIFVDRGRTHGRDGGPAVDEDRFLEIWNVVFMQNECDEHSNVLRDLPTKSIDTGSSLERVAMVLQGGDTVFDTDLLRPLVESAERVTGRRYGAHGGDDVSLRVIAEHGRATTFLVADGVLPSNEGRGYVLRRMLRRLVTYARKLGVDKPVLGDLVETTVDVMGGAYPELVANRAFILQVLASEEERFAGTLRQGLTLLEHALQARPTPASHREAGSRAIAGDVAFKLHDTYGFPVELTIELAKEAGLGVDTDAFAALMDEQRRRARGSQRKSDVAEDALREIASVAGPTEFVGYERLSVDGRIVGMTADGVRVETAGVGTAVLVVLDRTAFYAEGGGQVGDAGLIRTAAGLLEVGDTRAGPGDTIVHAGRITEGVLSQGQEAEAAVDVERRVATARSHTATHVLHHTIRQFLGEHARQAGSLVAPGRLRFDFTHFEPVPRHSLEEIEYLTNRRLADDQPIRAYETTQEFARSEGAIALFGEKYGDIVRVVEVGDYSVELCGGTHVRHTGEVSMVRLVSEGSIGSGFRRLEALTGPDALKQVNVERRLLEEVVEAAGGGDASGAPERVRQALARIKALESELGKLQEADRGQEVKALLDGAREVCGAGLVVARLESKAQKELQDMAKAVRGALRGPGAVVLGSVESARPILVAACSDELIGRGVEAPRLLERASQAIEGGGGGRPALAFAGGRRPQALDSALATIEPQLKSLLGCE